MKKTDLMIAAMVLMGIILPTQADITTTGDVRPADPSTWTSTITGYIGDATDGTMDITLGSTVSNQFGYIGFDAGVTGAVTVDGAGSSWANAASLRVGLNGNGTLNITNGGLVSGASYMGINSGGESFVTMGGGGMLALVGNVSDLTGFLGLVGGSDDIRYWDGAAWSNITGAAAEDYSVVAMTSGDLNGYSVLTVTAAVPEPATMGILALGGIGVLLKRRRRPA